MSRTDPFVREFGIVNPVKRIAGAPKLHINRRFGVIPDSQESVFIRHDNTNPDRARLGIDHRVDERYAAGELPPGRRLHFRFDFLPVADRRRVFGKQLQHQPDGGQVGQSIDRLAGLYILAFDRELFDDRAADRSAQVDAAVGFAGLFKLLKLRLGHAELD